MHLNFGSRYRHLIKKNINVTGPPTLKTKKRLNINVCCNFRSGIVIHLHLELSWSHITTQCFQSWISLCGRGIIYAGYAAFLSSLSVLFFPYPQFPGNQVSIFNFLHIKMSLLFDRIYIAISAPRLRGAGRGDIE